MGGGPCGWSALSTLISASLSSVGAVSSRMKITILEQSLRLGAGTAFQSRLGAQAMSFNIAEPRMQAILNRIVAGMEALGLCKSFRHTDDGLLSAGLLSRTKERPQGWNRGTGQWEHYTLGDGKDFGSLMAALLGEGAGDGDRAFELRLGCEARTLRRSVDRGGWLLTVFEGGSGNQELEFDAVILAVPAKRAAALLEGCIGQEWEEHAIDVIKRCASDYVRRHSVLLGLMRKGDACMGMLARFREIFCESEGTHDGRIGMDTDMAMELDTEAVVPGGCVCLLSVCAMGEEEVRARLA